MIKLTIDQIAITVPEGTTVAAAILGTGEGTFRRSVAGDPRGPFCGMGICFECRVTIDGRANQTSCTIPVEGGMVICTDR